MITNVLYKKLDCFLAATGVLLGVLIALLYLISPIIDLFSIGISLILSCSLYLIIIYLQFPTYPLQHTTKNWKKMLDITFLLFLSLSLIIMHNFDYRPIVYFLLCSLCTGLIAASIYYSDNNIDYFIQYLKIIILSFNLKYSIFNLAGFIPGVDPWIHAKMNYVLSQTGNIEALLGSKEMYFPIMHIQVAAMELLSNVSVRDASNFAIIVPFVFASSFVYLVSKYFLGHRIGLFALLLVNVSDFHTYWGSAPQTTSYGTMLYYLLIYVLIKAYFMNSNMKWTGISIFLIFILIITHAVSSFIFLITIVSFFLGSISYTYLYEGVVIPKFKSISLITVVALLQQWFVAVYSTDRGSFFNVIVFTLNFYLTEYAGFLNRPETVSAYSTFIPPFIERFADVYGFSLFLFFGIIGSLFCLSDKYRNRGLFTFVFALAVLFGITYSFPLFGIRNIMPSRWFIFEYFFLSILASFSILKLSTYFKGIKFKPVFVAVIFISIAFFMSTSTVSNVDSPIWLKNNTVSTTYTLGEVRGAETLSKLGNNFVCDYLFGQSVISSYCEQNYTMCDPNGNFDYGKIFIWRSYMEQGPITYFRYLKEYYKPISSAVVLGENFHCKLNKYNKIYSNKGLSAYYIKN